MLPSVSAKIGKKTASVSGKLNRDCENQKIICGNRHCKENVSIIGRV